MDVLLYMLDVMDKSTQRSLVFIIYTYTPGKLVENYCYDDLIGE